MTTSEPAPIDPRRRSTFFRNRASIVILDSIRSTPFKICCFLSGISSMGCGVVFYFFCGRTFTDDPVEKAALAMFEDCDSNPHTRIIAGMAGAGLLVYAALRFACTQAKRVSDLYYVMLLCSFQSLLYVWNVARVWDPEIIFFPYMIPFVFCVIIDMYVLWVARVAHVKRQKGPKETSQKED